MIYKKEVSIPKNEEKNWRRQVKNWLCVKGVKLLIGINVCFLLAFSFLLLRSENKTLFTSFETQELIIRGPENQAYIEIKSSKDKPQISLIDKKGVSRVCIEGGDDPTIIFKNGNSRF